jgi:hypothetical protein
MRDYLRDLGDSQQIPLNQRVDLEQLGHAKGGLIDRGVNVEVAALSFLLVFAASSLAVLFVSRVRRGWVSESQRDTALDVPEPSA